MVTHFENATWRPDALDNDNDDTFVRTYNPSSYYQLKIRQQFPNHWSERYKNLSPTTYSANHWRAKICTKKNASPMNKDPSIYWHVSTNSRHERQPAAWSNGVPSYRGCLRTHLVMLLHCNTWLILCSCNKDDRSFKHGQCHAKKKKKKMINASTHCMSNSTTWNYIGTC